MTDTNTNPFDFSDLSDLPEELSARMTKSGGTEYIAVVDIIKAAAEAGIKSLTLVQVMVAASRMGVALKEETTTRNWLNKGVKLGYLGKPTTQTYAIAGSFDTAAVTADPQQFAAVQDVPAGATAGVSTDADPLADL